MRSGARGAEPNRNQTHGLFQPPARSQGFKFSCVTTGCDGDGVDPIVDGVDDCLVEELEAVFSAEFPEVGAEAPLEDGGVGPSSSGGAASADDVAAQDNAWREYIGPYESGRIYFKGRSVGRVVHGEPSKNQCKIFCQNPSHKECWVILPLRKVPSDEAIKKWLAAGERLSPDAGKAERLAATARHKSLAMQWKN